MKAVCQRVITAKVEVSGAIIGRTFNPRTESECGLVILLGVQTGDTAQAGSYLAKKIAELRIFNDNDNKMNRSVEEVGGSLLVVSQFTLLGDCTSGRRPSFIKAARPEEGESLYNHFVQELKSRGLPVQTGKFGAHMQLSLINDGPVTLILEY